MEMRFEVYKITELRDGAIYRTKKVKSDLWLRIEPRTEEQKQALARQHGGDLLCPTVETR